MKEYFGILKGQQTEGLSINELIDIFVKQGLFYTSRSLKAEVINGKIRVDMSGNFTKKLSPTIELTNSFYDYLKQLLKEEIEYPFLNYFRAFNEEIFGLDTSNKKKIAIRDFKDFYNEIKALDGDFLQVSTSSDRIEHVNPLNRFLFLKGRQSAIKNVVASIEKEYIFQYLIGNEDYFKKGNLLKIKDINDLIAFESFLKVLLSLNDQFKFEDNFEFNKLGFLKDKFQEYQHLFYSLNIFIYTYNKISSFDSKSNANIYSLYQALFELNHIKNSKANFIKYANKEHQYNLTKIIPYRTGENYKHDERVTDFLNDLNKYAEE